MFTRNRGFASGIASRLFPARRSRGLAAAVALVLMLSSYAVSCYATPIMDVTLQSTTVGDYVPSHPGDEYLWTYTFWNNSDPGDINNMISAALESNNNADMGIIDIWSGGDMCDWAYSPNPLVAPIGIVNLDCQGSPVLPKDSLDDSVGHFGKLGLFTNH